MAPTNGVTYILVPEDTVRGCLDILDEVCHRWYASPAPGKREEAIRVESAIMEMEKALAVDKARARLWGAAKVPCAPPPEPEPVVVKKRRTREAAGVEKVGETS